MLLEAVSEVFADDEKVWDRNRRQIYSGRYLPRTGCIGKITHELLSLEDRPTCIVYPDDFSCIGGINVIRSKGLTIPNDISVAGYDGQRIARVIEPKITTYRQNTEQIGRVAATKLVELIEQPELALVERLDVQGELIRGCSVLSMK